MSRARPLAPAIVNAANLHSGGGATLACNFLGWLAGHGKNIIALVPDLPPFRALPWTAHVRPIFLPPRQLQGWRRLQFDSRWLPRLCQQERARSLFTMGNIGPAHAPCPHTVLVQNAFYAYGACAARRTLSPRVRLRLRLEEHLLARCLRTATTVIAQSSVMAARLGNAFRLPPDRIRVVENAVDTERLTPQGAQPAREFRLLLLSRFYPHKNFAILPAVACALRSRSPRPCRFLLTLEPGGGGAAGAFLRDLRRSGVSEMFDNVGPVDYDHLPQLYASADALLLPTLLESSTASYSEAMHFGVPIITSNLDFARAACGEAALYCDPLNPAALAEAVIRLQLEPDLAARCRENGRRRLQDRGWSWSIAAPRLAAAAGLEVG